MLNKYQIAIYNGYGRKKNLDDILAQIHSLLDGAELNECVELKKLESIISYLYASGEIDTIEIITTWVESETNRLPFDMDDTFATTAFHDMMFF